MSMRGMAFRAFVTLAAAGTALAFTGAVASAAVEHTLIFSFGPGGPGSGAFSNIQAAAVDQSTGDVYVYDKGAEAIYKFNAAGEPAEFSALKSSVIEGVGGAARNENQLAVDSSTGPAEGDIYFAKGPGSVAIYGPDGSPRGALTGEVENFGGAWGEPCGVAVDPAGHVYVGLATGHVDKYTPTPSPPAAFPVTDADYTSKLSGLNVQGEICNIAADAEGNVYTQTYSRGFVTRYAASQFGEPTASGTLVDELGYTLAVDPVSGELYVVEPSEIAQYESSGALVGRFAPGAGLGVAVNSSSRDVYVAQGEEEAETIGVYDTIVLPSATTGAALSITSQAATLQGEANPQGGTLTTCEFEYGTESSYGSVVPCASLPGPGNSFVPVSAQVTGLEPNRLYHYTLTVSDGSHTLKGKDATFTTRKAPPTVNGQPAFASNVSQLGATLDGVVDPGNVLTSYHFAYGTTIAYGSVAPVPDESVPIDNHDNPVTQVLVGLKPGTIYHFALIANSPGGTTVGPDETFQTPSIPAPAVSSGAASEVTVGAVTLSGAIDPQGWETSYYFEYGPSAAYGSRWPSIDVVLGGLNGAQGVVSDVQNLQPRTLYHYRLVATNPGGTSYGSDQTFITSEYPASAIQETPLLQTPKIDLPGSSLGESKPLTRAQKLANALRTCRKKPRSQRASCEKRARKRYAKAKKK
jgi:hypothetical protein